MTTKEFREIVIKTIPSKFLSERVCDNLYIWMVIIQKWNKETIEVFFMGVHMMAWLDEYSISNMEMDEWNDSENFDIVPYRDYWREKLSYLNGEAMSHFQWYVESDMLACEIGLKYFYKLAHKRGFYYGNINEDKLKSKDFNSYGVTPGSDRVPTFVRLRRISRARAAKLAANN